MFYFIISAVLIAVFTYSVLGFALKIPPLKISFLVMSMMRKGNESGKRSFQLFHTLSHSISAYVPISMAKEIKLSRMLQNVSTETPKEFVARLIVIGLFISIFALPCLLITPLLALLPLITAIIVVFVIVEETKDKALKQHRAAEKEIPSFIETFTHNVKTNRNIIAIFDTYIQNYSTPLSHELARTVADMRTGSTDIALKRFEMRMNNPLLSQLIRGILATMRGEDMTSYFSELVKKVSEIRKKLLTQKALKVKPKISLMSNVRGLWAIGVLLYIVGVAVLEYMKGSL